MAANPIFDDVLFPLGISTGATGGPVYKTNLVPAASGFEQRNAAWGISRLKWSIGKGLIKPADRDLLVAFFRARQGRLRAFRFRDPFDNATASTGQALPYAGGLTVQLVKVYADAANPQTRIIKKPVAGSVSMLRDGVAWASAGNWTVNTATGIVTLNADQAGHTLAWIGQYDTPARFDQDEMNLSLEDLFTTWNSIEIIEEFLP